MPLLQKDMPIVFMFSGQGSQYYQMGLSLYEENKYFKLYLDELDSMAVELFENSIIEEIYKSSKSTSDEFDDLVYSHQAILMVELALSKTMIRYGINPDYLLGASLGEYVAYALSGVVTTSEIFKIIYKQAQLAMDYCRPGRMVAILNPVDYYYQTRELFQNSELAATNFDGHFVVSCSEESFEIVKYKLIEDNTVFQKLPIKRAFHSSLIEPVKAPFVSYLMNFDLHKPELPVVSCAMAKTLETVENDYFWSVARNPIDFQNTIKRFACQRGYIFIDLGPSGTLSTFLKYNVRKETSSLVFSIMTPFGGDDKMLSTVCEEIKYLGIQDTPQ